jgi:hypothetical protein
MVRRQSLLTRVLAAVLPGFFLWAFAGCVSLCSIHSAETQKTHLDVSSSGIERSHDTDTDCCPITATPATALPERLLIASQVCGDHHVSIALAQELSSHLAGGHVRSARLAPSTSDPPFERLSILRI